MLQGVEGVQREIALGNGQACAERVLNRIIYVFQYRYVIQRGTRHQYVGARNAETVPRKADLYELPM